ncbi:hypothetical protein [Pedobacter suwonensis]|uniref:hypothetical protein n=1 Tax=Pedobacter suwonensis TaxID=332999 RepID=UPI0011A2C887|nr:hypothetical protein [Pedobacter suwonensis]
MNSQTSNIRKAIACVFLTILIIGSACRKDNHDFIVNFPNEKQFIKEELIYDWLKQNPLSQVLAPNWAMAQQTVYQGKKIVRIPIFNVDKLNNVISAVSSNKGYDSKHPPELFFVQNTNGQIAGYLINFIPKDLQHAGGENGVWTGNLVEWNIKGDTLHVMEVVDNKIIKDKLIVPENTINNNSLSTVLKVHKMALAESGSSGDGGFWSFLGRVLGAIGDFLGLPTRNTYADGLRIDWGEITRSISSWFDGAESYTGGGSGGGTYLSAGGPVYASYLGSDLGTVSGGPNSDIAPLIYNQYTIYKGGPSNPPTPPNEDGIYIMEYMVLTPDAQEYILTYPAIPLTKMIRDYLDFHGWNQDNLALATWAVEYSNNNPDPNNAIDPIVKEFLTTGAEHVADPNEDNWTDNDDVSLIDPDQTIYQQYQDNQPWATVDRVIPFEKFVPIRWIKKPDGSEYSVNCLVLAKEQLGKAGYTCSGYLPGVQTFQTYKESTGVDLAETKKAISYIISALSQKIPVLIGVDNRAGTPSLRNADGTTDHFVVIVAMGTDSKGKYFQFMDSATKIPAYGASFSNRLYYNSSTGKITGKTAIADYRNISGMHDYIVTQVRKSIKK